MEERPFYTDAGRPQKLSLEQALDQLVSHYQTVARRYRRRRNLASFAVLGVLFAACALAFFAVDAEYAPAAFIGTIVTIVAIEFVFGIPSSFAARRYYVAASSTRAVRYHAGELLSFAPITVRADLSDDDVAVDERAERDRVARVLFSLARALVSDLPGHLAPPAFSADFLQDDSPPVRRHHRPHTDAGPAPTH